MATFNALSSVPIGSVSRMDGQRFLGGAPLPLILINLQDEFSFLIEQVNPLNLSAEADNII